MDLRRGGKAAIDRMLKAYDLPTKQALCEKLGISNSTLANRYLRDTFPADLVIQCALETGVSLHWLVTGKNGRTSQNEPIPSPEPFHSHETIGLSQKVEPEKKFSKSNIIDFKMGGRGVIERLLEAYGFKTRQALCDHLGVSKSTLATRYMRDLFPAEWVIQCTIETGVSLRWLATGEGPRFDDARNDVIAIPRQKLIDGKLYDSNYYMFDKAFLPDGLKDPVVILDSDITYIADRQFDEVVDGKWLVEIEGRTSIRDLTRIPVGKVRVSGTGAEFDCGLGDIQIIAECKGFYKGL